MKKRHLPGLALILVMVLGLVSSLLALVSPKGELWRAGLSWGRLADGRDTAALSSLLNDQLLGGHALATAARAIDWLILGDLGGQVWRGCDNWLFLTEELAVHPDGARDLARRADLVARIRDRLAARSIGLVVAVVPDKSRIEAAHLCGVPRPAVLAGRLADFTGRLRAAGVVTADLAAALTALDGERYYRTDTHWNEAGAEAAARAVAASALGAGLAPPPQGPAKITRGQLAERSGDLIRLAGLDGLPPWLRPVPDRQVADSRIEPPAAPGAGLGDDLLGDSAGPAVVVVGSSYSRNANFTGFLADHLQVAIANMAEDGGGFAGAASRYFANPAFTQTPPRLLVWEMPERVLDQPFSAHEVKWDAEIMTMP